MSTEHDKFTSEMEAKKAAELKAKLEMVETRPKVRHGRQHRKIGEMVCDTGVKTGWQNATASFVLRLNSGTGEFIAEHGDTEYASKSRDALQARMNQVAKVTIDLKWTRYLLVDYKATVKCDESDRWGGDTDVDIDAPRRGRPVFGISLKWETVEYSGTLELPGQGEQRFMKRDVDEDGEASSAQETVSELPDGLILHTKERESMLRKLREALGQLDARMVELFSGDPDDVSRRLDELDVATVGAVLALGAPAVPARKLKR